jgi:hypothetical protein
MLRGALCFLCGRHCNFKNYLDKLHA